MKKIIPFLLIGYLVAERSDAQSNLPVNTDSMYSYHSENDKPVKGSREYYLHQASVLNSAGTASLVLGGVLIAAEFILHSNGSDDVSTSVDVQAEAVKLGAANFCKGAGIVLAAISIPLFIAGDDAKKKAITMSPSIGFQKTDLPIVKGIRTDTFPSIGFKINF